MKQFKTQHSKACAQSCPKGSCGWTAYPRTIQSSLKLGFDKLTTDMDKISDTGEFIPGAKSHRRSPEAARHPALNQEQGGPQVERGQLWRNRITHKRYWVLAARDGAALLMSLDMARGERRHWQPVPSMLLPRGDWVRIPVPQTAPRQLQMPSGNVRPCNVYFLQPRAELAQCQDPPAEQISCLLDGSASKTP